MKKALITMRKATANQAVRNAALILVFIIGAVLSQTTAKAAGNGTQAAQNGTQATSKAARKERTVAKAKTAGHVLKVTQDGKKTRIYYDGTKVKTYRFTGKVKIIDARNLTAQQIEHRKNKTLYIERTQSRIIDDQGNGKTREGYYISFGSCQCKDMRNARKGDRVTTYAILSPYNNRIDNTDFRVDICHR